MVTFDWPGTSEATDCFPVVYEQDLDELASGHCRTKSGFLALLCAVRKWPSCQQLKQNPNLGDWLADFPPHWLPPHNLLACLWGWEAGEHGLPVQSHMWSGYMVRLLAVLACICSVKGITDLEEPSSVLSSEWWTFLHRQSPHWHSWPSTWISPDGTDSLLFSEAA